MNKSESIKDLSAALAKAQGAMSAAKMDSTNPFLKNKYADLGSVIQAARQPLSANGLSFTQHPAVSESHVSVTTLLMHASGEWIESEITLPLDGGKGLSLAQSMGAIITYLRRYSLSAILGIYADEDNDGNESKKPVQALKENGNGHAPAVQEAPAAESVKPNPDERPFAPESLMLRLAAKASKLPPTTTCTDMERNMIAVNINSMFAGQSNADAIRHSVLKYLTGQTSVKELTPQWVKTLKGWIASTQDSGGEWQPDVMATKEAQSVWTAALEASGQSKLL